MKIQNVKGGYDYLPKEQIVRNYINDTLKGVFEEYGYKSIETPILCYYDILSDKYDENNDLLKEIYKLTDQGNRTLGLRYDLTVPFAKLIALNKNKIKYPFKRYEIAKVFRDGPIKAGRDREFTQCDVDVVGLDGQLIEAELLSLYVNAFKKLNIEIIIKYNSRNLMKGLILECGINENLVSKVVTILDKLEKLTRQEITELLLNIDITSEMTDKLLNYFTLSFNELNTLFTNTNNKTLLLGLEELNNLEKFIQKLDLEDYCVFTPTLARGQDYYTGNVFEVYEKNNRITSSIGGGGRYDQMITEFINDGTIYPAVGISFGLSSLYELLKDKIIDNKIDIYIIPMNTNVESLRLANRLRTLGYRVDIEMNNRKLKKSLDYANKELISYVIVLGEEEVLKKCFKLKDMRNSCEYLIEMDNIEKIKDFI